MKEAEKKLVMLALEGDTDAFGELVDLYWEKVSALVYQKLGQFPEVEDIVQETFIKSYYKLPQLRKPQNFAAWLYQIASMLCIDHLRSRKKNLSLEAMKEKDIQFEKSGQEFTPSDLFGKIVTIIGSLPEIYRVVVTLRFLEGMSCKEIAQHLGEPQGTIRNRLFRANEILRRKLAASIKEYILPGQDGQDSQEKKSGSKEDKKPGD